MRQLKRIMHSECYFDSSLSGLSDITKNHLQDFASFLLELIQ